MRCTAQGTHCNLGYCNLIRCSISALKAGPGETERNVATGGPMIPWPIPYSAHVLPNSSHSIKPYECKASCFVRPLTSCVSFQASISWLNTLLVLIFRSQTMMYLIISFLRVFFGTSGPHERAYSESWATVHVSIELRGPYFHVAHTVGTPKQLADLRDRSCKSHGASRLIDLQALDRVIRVCSGFPGLIYHVVGFALYWGQQSSDTGA